MKDPNTHPFLTKIGDDDFKAERFASLGEAELHAEARSIKAWNRTCHVFFRGRRVCTYQFGRMTSCDLSALEA